MITRDDSKFGCVQLEDSHRYNWDGHSSGRKTLKEEKRWMTHFEHIMFDMPTRKSSGDVNKQLRIWVWTL